MLFQARVVWYQIYSQFNTALSMTGMKNRPSKRWRSFFARRGEELLITSMALWILSRTGQKNNCCRERCFALLSVFLSFLCERTSIILWERRCSVVYNGTLLWTKRARAPIGSSDAFARGAWKIKDFYSSESATEEMFCILSNAVCWRERSHSENGARTCGGVVLRAHPLLTRSSRTLLCT